MIKSERGSVTVFTLSACLLMSFILVGIFMGSQNKVINQKKQLKSIENSYKENSDNEKMAQLYEEAMKNDPSNIEADLKITTAEELKEFANQVNGGNTFEGKIVVLMNDIDLSSVCSSTIGSWTPIGNSTAKTFKGTFNGRNYTISNLYIMATGDYQGLFGINEGTIKNIKIDAGQISCNVNSISYFGMIASYNKGQIISCKTVGGQISGNGITDNAGGITGYNTGTIKKCSNNIIISVYAETGGISGTNKGGTIQECYNIAKVSGYGSIGGIAGENLAGSTLKNCYNTADISASTNYGGINGTNRRKYTKLLFYRKRIKWS